ncbi:MAG: outer membrane beta-barrel protein [Verrucomicrobia bacterium]|nr:outer membrane beta-barrel protein [Verrucomicrobiota bacterium]
MADHSIHALPALRRPLRALASLALVLLVGSEARALLRFNDSKEQVYVTAYVGAGYDSNVFSRGTGAGGGAPGGDLLISAGAGMEYARKAGLIGVNASLGWDLGNFTTFTSENFLNPSASLEFSKGTGRTTGAIQFNVRKETRADPTVGLRTDTWNYGVNLNYRYPVIERYSFAGSLGWDTVSYSDPGPTFSNLNTYNISTDLFYNWRSDRDLLAGYRYRTSIAEFLSTSQDHSIYAGLSGRILAKLSGSARVGWTLRTNEYPNGVTDAGSNGVYFSLAGTWPATRKATYSVSATQDFNTTSTNFQTQTTSLDLTGKFSHSVKFNTNATIGVGQTEFISGYASDAPAVSTGFNGQDRLDNYLTAGVGADYTFKSHFTVSTSYTYYQNWSNLSAFVFQRHSISLTLSTRW